MRDLIEELFDAHPGELPYLVHDGHVVSRAEVRATLLDAIENLLSEE